ncbi:hypothetical protein NDU88_005153 [Pleurodeles waltl]|uniref:Arb2 domain-containing protein n=1 Tax=Pleurodeles waltl TaxID=8319 RepID=A0AAV7NN51_PLEWA|nr:hypothetical protein NDU88_005153 [Pleurodeles waltl]
MTVDAHGPSFRVPATSIYNSYGVRSGCFRVVRFRGLASLYQKNACWFDETTTTDAPEENLFCSKCSPATVHPTLRPITLPCYTGRECVSDPGKRCPKQRTHSWMQMETFLKFLHIPESSKILKDLKYHFNNQGELRHLDTNKHFDYNFFKGDHKRNHKRYQVLGHMITQYIYELLEKACSLQKIYFPIDAHDNEPLSFFFMTEEALNNPSSLIVLLQDRGVIRAGQWGQKAIIHHSLQHGTQIPFIERALQEYGGVILLNPNDNFTTMKMEEESESVIKEESPSERNVPHSSFEIREDPEIPKRGSSTPEEHTTYVWDYFISKSSAANVAFIAHGYGGLVFVDLLLHRRLEIMSKVFAVAFIDSLHHVQHQASNDPEE